MGDKGGGGNRILITAGGGGNRGSLAILFSVKSGNRAPPRSAGRGRNGAPRTMDKFEGGNERGNRAKPPRKDPVIKHYAKHSRTVRFRKGND